MTPNIDELLSDIKQARQQRGMNAWWQDVLQRAHRAIGDLRELSDVNVSGCDRALTMLEISAATCDQLTSEVERLQAALEEISELYSGGHGYRAKEIALRALGITQQRRKTT